MSLKDEDSEISTLRNELEETEKEIKRLSRQLDKVLSSRGWDLDLSSSKSDRTNPGSSSQKSSRPRSWADREDKSEPDYRSAGRKRSSRRRVSWHTHDADYNDNDDDEYDQDEDDYISDHRTTPSKFANSLAESFLGGIGLGLGASLLSTACAPRYAYDSRYVYHSPIPVYRKTTRWY
ncbi:uncharacterized protein I303_100282 [Kwoniella dejecticola CBS 10117]|uniref:Uncharacterized protein n=1 Tax=Kwoniella dejecticola CBS 10117 TaxID=1296121 RepID=A0A1A6AEG6_9TREE|nr:uncharacterized protein I303_00283 [Kwoniella dejecticola CBS 10117]OBR88466.1 hypothetical protein I303_00283 [Kwoniella dejecticola CBS 10117]